eukprot:GHVT01000940.1.p1 GENE.GHVT01000940.1~~GHVT01000940.1.p1  ORF type:complete len:249 (-),score=35.32 GHVT01000940.1:483-1229(-)
MHKRVSAALVQGFECDFVGHINTAQPSGLCRYPRSGPEDRDVMATILLLWDFPENSQMAADEKRCLFEVAAHFCAIRQHPPVICVQVRAGGRANPQAKDSTWACERASLENQMEGMNEVVMEGLQGRITEGLTSNFFAIRDGTLYTAAPTDVLAGTVRRLVLEVAPTLGLQVKLEAPRSDEADSWDSCFITSTSRLVKPINSITFLDPPRTVSFPKLETSQARKIQEEVAAVVYQKSTPLASIQNFAK